MSLKNIVRSVAGRLSPRAPQAESLERLHNAIESVPALRDSKARSHRRWLGCAEAGRPVEIVKKTVAVFVEHAIDIPRISVVPKGPVKSGYKAFQIDVEKMNFQPQDMALIGQEQHEAYPSFLAKSSARRCV